MKGKRGEGGRGGAQGRSSLIVNGTSPDNGPILSCLGETD